MFKRLALQFQLQGHNNSLDIFQCDNKRVAYTGKFLFKILRGGEGVACFVFAFYSDIVTAKLSSLQLIYQIPLNLTFEIQVF